MVDQTVDCLVAKMVALMVDRMEVQSVAAMVED